MAVWTKTLAYVRHEPSYPVILGYNNVGSRLTYTGKINEGHENLGAIISLSRRIRGK